MKETVRYIEFDYVFCLFIIPYFLEWRTESYRGKSLSRPSISDWCSDSENYENEKNTESQLFDKRTIQTTDFSS